MKCLMWQERKTPPHLSHLTTSSAHTFHVTFVSIHITLCFYTCHCPLLMLRLIGLVPWHRYENPPIVGGGPTRETSDFLNWFPILLTHELQETNSEKRNCVRKLDWMNSPPAGWPINPPFTHSIERSEVDNNAVEPLILIKWTWTHDCCNFHAVSELQGISIKTENR